MKKFLSGIINGIKEVLSDENNRLSSKRVVGVLCATTLCVTLYENSFSEEHIAPSTILVESVAALAGACLGLASIDKFTKRKHQKSEKTEEKTEE
jgi:hypothetical protein